MQYETRVVQEDDGFAFQCACGFCSSGWADEDLALARGEQHTAEHESGEPAPELVDFRAEHGLNGEAISLIRFADAAPADADTEVVQ